MSLAQIKMETTRGAILGLLIDGNWENDSILYRAVNAVKNVDAARDDVRAAMQWLAGKGLVELWTEEARLDRTRTLRARITDMGRDFEAGRIYVEGVHRPSGR
jgi:hypothetical protein